MSIDCIARYMPTVPKPLFSEEMQAAGVVKGQIRRVAMPDSYATICSAECNYVYAKGKSPTTVHRVDAIIASEIGYVPDWEVIRELK